MSKFQKIYEEIMAAPGGDASISVSTAFSSVGGEPAEYLGEPSGFSPQKKIKKDVEQEELSSVSPVTVSSRLK